MKSSRAAVLAGVCALSLVIAYMSSLSDHAPWTKNPDIGQIALYGLAGTLNDFTVWLICVIFVARLLGTGWHRCTVIGLGWAVSTVWLYLLMEALIFNEGHSDGLSGLVMWTGLAAFGGVTGGLIAALMDRFPIAIAPLAALAVLRLRDPAPWHSAMGLIHQATLVLVLVWCIGYWAKHLVARHCNSHPRQRN